MAALVILGGRGINAPMGLAVVGINVSIIPGLRESGNAQWGDIVDGQLDHALRSSNPRVMVGDGLQFISVSSGDRLPLNHFFL